MLPLIIHYPDYEHYDKECVEHQPPAKLPYRHHLHNKENRQSQEEIPQDAPHWIRYRVLLLPNEVAPLALDCSTQTAGSRSEKTKISQQIF